MVKLADLDKAFDAGVRLENLNVKLNQWRNAKKIEMAHEGILLEAVELEGFDPPSAIGACFRAVKDAAVNLINSQIADAERELRALGVDLSAAAALRHAGKECQ